MAAEQVGLIEKLERQPLVAAVELAQRMVKRWARARALTASPFADLCRSWWRTRSEMASISLASSSCCIAPIPSFMV
jgi:hypothetical protein